ncbi:unnamed protein product [Adineta steineri]|uniref:NAD(P)(+)--arginine ADP-ribosyltransferase n=1 Tax=Adineta steineri TaxID=433720 RepID=A0A818MMC9_9BILA|nr:unnamed protein product [Adineta steineri]CAF3591833.1 unnamed protein product [Adineta steineri]
MDPKSSKPSIKSSHGATASYVRQPRQRMAQNCLLLWVDTSIDQTNEDYENTLKQIRSVTGDVNIFTERDACIDFLTDAQEDIKSFLVVKDTMFQQIMPLINDIPQLDGVYIFNDINTLHEEWTKKWQKIKSVHANIDHICQGLQSDIKQYHQGSIAMSFITVNEMASTNNLNELDPTFMYTQLFKEILLDMEHNKQAIKDFITYCRHNDCLSSTNINRFEKEYNAELAIWWYTFPSNIYSMLNYALRTLDADIIINMGFFLRDVHKQIQQLYKQQVSSYGGKSFKIYRGQGLTKLDFEKLQKTKGGLMSFNNFLSTSKDKEVSLEFAECASTKPDTVGILFIMSINPCIKSVPFASIKEMSHLKEEEEILFSMHTVFRVGAIHQIDKNNQLYQVELQLTSDDDQELRVLTDRIRKEAVGTGWQSLGTLLLKIGQFNKGEELYNVLLEQTSAEGEKAHYYVCLGYVKNDLGDYEKAIWFLEKALEIQEKNFPPNHPDLATSYNNIGSVYNSMGEQSKAISFFEKALEIQEKTLPLNYADLGKTYNNIGSVYFITEDYSKALSFFEKALEILLKILPANHPHLATSYNNIAGVCHNMGEYSKALSSHEKALEIRQKNLPANHPHLATSYNNIGLVCADKEEYSKALSFYEKALEIRLKTLPLHHPDLATSYSNIASGYNNMGEYSKALSYYEKALEIFEKTLPSNHPHLATSYNNIGSVYDNIEEYSKAISFYEKALEIRQKILPSNHPDLDISYRNIGLVHYKIGEHSKALSFFEKALKILKKAVPLNHTDLSTTHNNIGSIYYIMEDYSKALLFYQKGLEIRQKNLPANHLDLATSYNNIGLVYDNMREYSKALLSHGKAFEIRQQTLPLNHPDLATSYRNIGLVYNKLGEYSKALSCFERALDIWQRALPPTHSDIKSVKENIEIIKIEIRKNN